MLGCAILAFATTPAVAALGFVFLGINFGVSWPAFNSLIAAVTTGEMRQQYFGVNFALVNLGIGVGGVIGGMYADVGEPRTFTVIFLADAASMLVPITLLLGPLRHISGVHEAPDDADAASGSYLAILRKPAVLWMTALTFIAVFVGYAQLEAGFPAFARQVGDVSTRVIGFSFAVNTAVIVCLQFLVLRRIAGRRRTRVMVVMAAVWAASWLVLGVTALGPGAVAAAGVLAFAGVFALGETMLQPTVPAITNDMAPDHLRGRYNAVNAGRLPGRCHRRPRLRRRGARPRLVRGLRRLAGHRVRRDRRARAGGGATGHTGRQRHSEPPVVSADPATGEPTPAA